MWQSKMLWQQQWNCWYMKTTTVTETYRTRPINQLKYNILLDSEDSKTRYSHLSFGKVSIAAKVTDDSCALRILSSVPFHYYKHACTSRSWVVCASGKVSHSTYHAELSQSPYHYEESCTYRTQKHKLQKTNTTVTCYIFQYHHNNSSSIHATVSL